MKEDLVKGIKKLRHDQQKEYLKQVKEESKRMSSHVKKPKNQDECLIF
jgi:hypothetical protein